MIIGGMVILGVGYGAYKLTQPQVQQIEQHTGQSAEDLTEEQLEQAMEQLGIEPQEPTDQEVAALEAEDTKSPSYPEETAAPPAPAATPAAAPAGESTDYLEEIEKLDELRKKGIITDEEFEAKKKDLLGL
jgi:hypothetical protein